jgi:aminopeptidase
MADPRIAQYADLIVERSLDPKPGWQVEILSSPLARPLVEEVVRRVAKRGAWPLVRLSYMEERWPYEYLWAAEAPEEMLAQRSPLRVASEESVDAWVYIGAPENRAEGSDVSPGKRKLLGLAGGPFLERRLNFDIPWLTCRFPTPAMAQDAGMSMRSFEDFFYGTVLLDWDAEGEKMNRIKQRFDHADEVRIVGDETDLRFSLSGREGHVDDGRVNLPGGEVFYSPLEDSAEGLVTFSEYPAVRDPDVVEGVRLRYEGGRVVEASAGTNEEALIAALDRDEGARVLGEFGIGCNPGIQTFMKNTLFDEKMYGTIHLAFGAGLPFIGGKNRSAMHWDMVKELRSGGRIECDGDVVQQNGEWTF